VKIQTRIRGFTKKSIYCRLKSLRRISVIKIQQAARCRHARKLCIELRKQQDAIWEQLWDAKRNVMYYYNRLTDESKFAEPRDVFRPLVRDKRSSRLLQAWPNLRRDNVESSKILNDLSICKICQFRKTVRKCEDCDVHNITPYCFPCYQKVHVDEDNVHRFVDVEGDHQVVSKSLRCSICNQIATRKCLGLFDDHQIDIICNDLLKSKITDWPKVLAQSNIAGEKKIQVILDNLNTIDNISHGRNPDVSDETLLFSYLQQIKTILERFRAECDECFCAECYEVVHTGGKRSLHRWIGFQANALVCNVCVRSPATMRCNYCTENSCYCLFCYKVFHSKGKKKRHTHSVIIEDMTNAADVFCDMCDRRPAQIPCENEKCNFFGCDSCYECNHKRSCRWNETEPKIPRQTAEQRLIIILYSLVSHYFSLFFYPYRKSDDISYITPEMFVCVNCGKEADSKCKQCGDFYCSETWMGNPGCFVVLHSKGNRVRHTKIDGIKERLRELKLRREGIERQKESIRIEKRKENILKLDKMREVN